MTNPLTDTLQALSSRRYTLRRHQVATRAEPMQQAVKAPAPQALRITVRELLADQATVDSSSLTPQVQSRLVEVVPLPARSLAAQRLARLVAG
jgi:hypothetical protein